MFRELTVRASNENLDLFQKLIQLNGPLQPDPTGRPLMLRLRNPDAIRMLVEMGGDINCSPGDGQTVLRQILLQPAKVKLELVRTILELGGNPNVANMNENACCEFKNVLKARRYDICQVLVDYGAIIPLGLIQEAIEDCDEQRCCRLISWGANFKGACQKLKVKLLTVETLRLFRSLELDEESIMFVSIHLLMQDLDLDEFNELVEAGVHLGPYVFDNKPHSLFGLVNNGDTAMFFIRNPDIIRSLAQLIDINHQNTLGQSALSGCLYPPETYRAMLELGADPNHQDSNGLVPLHRCLYHETAQLLIATGADVHHKNNYGRTVLHTCVTGDITKLFLDAGVDPNIPDKDGDLPIQTCYACPNKLVQLLRYGVDISAIPFDELHRYSHAGQIMLMEYGYRLPDDMQELFEMIWNNDLEQVAGVDVQKFDQTYLLPFVRTAEMAELLGELDLRKYLVHYINHNCLNVVKYLLPLPENWYLENCKLLRFQSQEMVDLLQFPTDPWHFSNDTFKHQLAAQLSDQELMVKQDHVSELILMRRQWVKLWVQGQKHNMDHVYFKLPKGAMRLVVLFQ